MIIKLQINRRKSGYALIIATILSAISLFILGSALEWTSTNSRLIERNNQYSTSVAAAEAATEQVIAQLNWDFYNKGETEVSRNLESYKSYFPKTTSWNQFVFSDANTRQPGTYVAKLSDETRTDLDSRYTGLFGFASLYRIISNASEQNTRQSQIVGAVKQDVWLTAIPVFQMAAFSTGDLEINPGKDMKITGRVHSNADIFYQPNGVKLTFERDVTAVGKITPDKKPGDPLIRNTNSTVKFERAHDSGAPSLNLPIGTNNSPDAIHAILEIPPSGEDPNSSLGQQRYYNKADLQILLSDSGLIVRTPSNGTNITSAQALYFINTNASFYNKREQKTVKAIEIDVAKFKAFAATNAILSPIKANLDVLYIADTRTHASANQSGVRLINGQSLPDWNDNKGLTVATPNPLYVKGDYNVTTNGAYSSIGTTNTAFTRPASLAADAITVLSDKWKDNKSTDSVDKRKATPTTINAAFLAGNVETTNGVYSGGLENFPRFLEEWDTANTFTYNGSMVMMFKSKIAKGVWGTADVYVPPTRNWAFDQNFMQPKLLPPATPEARRTYRRQWDVIAPNTTS